MRVSHIASVAAVAVTVACGDVPDFVVHQTGVVVASSAPFATKADLPQRMESTIAAALAYWGGSWTHLAGSTITLVDAQYVSCGDSQGAIGCYDGDFRISTRDPSLGTWHCIEQTVLVHEVGHAVIGDPLHMDPRWMGFAPVVEELAGRSGYDASGETGCELYPSVWRHLPARR